MPTRHDSEAIKADEIGVGRGDTKLAAGDPNLLRMR